MSVSDKLNDVIKKINGTNDIVSDIEKQIKNVKATTPLDPYRKTNWIELVKSINGTHDGMNTKSIIDQITGNLTNVQPSKNRVDAYDNMRALKKKMPIIRRALMIFVDNILSPDDITKRSLQVLIDDEKQDDEKYIDVTKQYKDILKSLEIDEKADEIIFNTLLDGDRFVEIINTQSELKRSAYKNNIILKESTTMSLDEYTQYTEERNRYILESEVQLDKIADLPHTKSLKLVFENVEDINKRNVNVTVTQNGEPISIPNKNDISDQFGLQDLSIEEHDPRNIIVLNSRKWILGYLFIDARVDFSYGLSNTKNVNSYMSNATTSSSGEQVISDELIKLLYDKIAGYLKDKQINDIPKNLYSTITNILQANKYNITGLNVRFIPTSNMVHFKNPSEENFPYGESYLADLSFIINMYLTRMIASTIYKVARAGKHLKIVVDVSGSRDAKGRIENVKRAMNSREFTSEDLNYTQTIPSIISTMENFFIPSVDGKPTLDIEPLELGSFADRDADDQSLLKNILTGIEIPPSLLGIEEYNSTKSTLSQESVIFARSIVRLQKMFTKSFTELVRKIYTCLNPNLKDSVEYLDLLVTFMPPRGIIAESLGNIYDQIHNIYDNLKAMGVSEDYIRQKFLSDFDWKAFAVEKIKNTKNNEEEEAGGNAEGGENFGF